MKDKKTLADIAFVGNTLGPFFEHDPKLGYTLLEPLATVLLDLDLESASAAWPFGATGAVRSALHDMQDGLSAGLESEALCDEYRRLFVGPAPKVAPPWGSVYIDPDSVVFGASTIALKDWLAQAGIAVAKGESDEPEDHIGTMLSLMSWIAQERSDLLEEFLRAHLLPWSSHFLAIVIEGSRHPFYSGLALLAKESLEGIQRELGIEVSYPHFYR